MKKILILVAMLVITISMAGATWHTAYQSNIWNGYPSGGYITGPAYSYYGNTPSVFYYPMYYPNGSFYAIAAWDQQARTWQYGNGQQTWGSGSSRYNPYD